MVESQSMAPAYTPGDRLVAMPLLYGVPIPFTRFTSPQLVRPRRGDMVLIKNPTVPETSRFSVYLSMVTDFFKGQGPSFETTNDRYWNNTLYLRRIIAIGGDTVRVEDNMAYVKPEGSTAYLSEQEIIPFSYTITIPREYEDWQENYPFHRDRDSIELSDGEIYVLADNRYAGDDSRSWGLVRFHEIRGKILLRYYHPAKSVGSKSQTDVKTD